MPMQNLDSTDERRFGILQRMNDAIEADDHDAYMQAVNDLANDIQQSIAGDYRALQNSNDNAVLAARGYRVLTSAETQFYERFIEAARSSNPRQAMTNIDITIPETVTDQIFEDITERHPLLGMISISNTGRLQRWLYANTSGVAKWGKLGKTIEDELSAEFTEAKTDMAQLTAFVPLPMYLLDLGPTWIDRFVRLILSESIAVAEELAVIKGTGKDEPIGMIKKLTGALDNVYQDKETTEFTSFAPAAYGTILETLTKTRNGHRRPVNSVALVVNPSDYFTKVFPATTVRTTDGSYNRDVFPFPTTVIQSAAMDIGKAVIGIPSLYHLYIGGGTNGGRIEYSDEYKFLEQVRTYKVVLYGYGQANDENAFLFLDISNLAPTNLKVEVVSENP